MLILSFNITRIEKNSDCAPLIQSNVATVRSQTSIILDSISHK